MKNNLGKSQSDSDHTKEEEMAFSEDELEDVSVERPSVERFIQRTNQIIVYGLNKMDSNYQSLRCDLFHVNGLFTKLKAGVSNAQQTRIKVDAAISCIERTRIKADTYDEIQKAIILLEKQLVSFRKEFKKFLHLIVAEKVPMQDIGANELKPIANSLNLYREQTKKDIGRTIVALNHNLAILKRKRKMIIEDRNGFGRKKITKETKK